MKSKIFLTTCVRVLNIGTAATLKETHFYLQKAFRGVSFPHGMPQSHSALQSHTGVFIGTTCVCPAAILLPCQMREAQVPGNEGFVRKAPRGLGSPTAPLAAAPAAHTCLLQESLRTTFSVVPGLGFSTCVWARSCNHSHYGWKSPLRSARPTISPAPSPWSPLNHVPTCHLHTFFEPSQGW